VDINKLSLLGKTTENRTTQSESSAARTLDRLGINEGEARLARILSTTDGAGARDGGGSRLMLEINGQQLPVRSDRALPAGELIRVLRTENELRLMDLPETPQRSVLSQALARKMPFQQSLGEGLNQLIAAASEPSTPQNLRNTINQLLETLPRPQQPTQLRISGPVQMPAGNAPAPQSPAQGPIVSSQSSNSGLTGQQVREWLSNSGTFREASLATAGQQGSAPGGSEDLKGRMIRMAMQLAQTELGGRASSEQISSHIRSAEALAGSQSLHSGQLQFPMPPQNNTTASAGAARESGNAGETLRLLAGMINRITVNQLHSQALSTQSGGDTTAANQTWVVEIPWVTANGEAKTLQTRIEERLPGEEGGDTEGEEGAMERDWRLTLALDLEKLGPVYFDLSLKGRRLTPRVWAEQRHTARLVEQTSDRLEVALSRLDLEVTPVECHLGRPLALKTQLSQHLVDERA